MFNPTTKLNLILVTLLATSAMVGCAPAGNALNTKTSALETSDTSSEPAPRLSAMAEKSVIDLESALRGRANLSNGATQQVYANSFSLNEAQISAILNAAISNLQISGVAGSQDLSAILPALIQGATVGTGSLGLGNMTAISSILSAVGAGSFSTILQSTSGNSSNALMELVTSTLFSNLGLAGISDPSVPGVSGNIIQALMAQLGGQSGLGSSQLSSLITAITNGSVSGIGGLGLQNQLLQMALNALNKNSNSGLSSIISAILGGGVSGGGTVGIPTIPGLPTGGGWTSILNGLFS